MDDQQQTAEGDQGLVFKPARELLVNDLGTLKVLSDPLRIRILGQFGEPHTVKEVAAELGIAANKLYYHINMLEEHGLIKVVDSRVFANLIEKRYQIVALRFQLGHSLVDLSGTEGEESIEPMLTSVFDLNKADIEQSLSAGLLDLSESAPLHRRLLLSRSVRELTPEQAVLFHDRMEEVFNEFFGEDGEDRTNSGEQRFALTFVMYPTSALYPTVHDPHNEE